MKCMDILVLLDYSLLGKHFSNSQDQIDYKLLKLKSNDFLANFKKSSYKDRVTYLNGLAKIKTDEVDGGKKLLEGLLNSKETPEYLKGLARSELTSLTLKSKTL